MPNGTEPNGTEPNGTEPNGTEPNGTEPNGTRYNNKNGKIPHKKLTVLMTLSMPKRHIRNDILTENNNCKFNCHKLSLSSHT